MATYERQLAQGLDWKPITRSAARSIALCHYYAEDLLVMFDYVDRGRVMLCAGHGNIRRKPGRWVVAQKRLLDSVRKGDQVKVIRDDGKQVIAQVYEPLRDGAGWKLQYGLEARIWNLVDVRGPRGAKKRRVRRTGGLLQSVAS